MKDIIKITISLFIVFAVGFIVKRYFLTPTHDTEDGEPTHI